MPSNTPSSPSSVYSDDSATEFPLNDRPNFHRKDTDASLLEYYSSPLAGQATYAHSLTKPIPKPRRQRSTETTDSASQYSSDEQEQPNAPTVVKRRPSNPSQGAQDRRRLHIVQMNTASEGDQRYPSTASDTGHESRPRSRNNSIRVRRGVEEKLLGLALIAPPDATPSSYTSSTTPLTDVQNRYLAHKRSESEVTRRPYYKDPNGPSSKTGLTTAPTNSALSSLVTTPEIGQEKEITRPVAAPVIVRLGSSSVPSPSSSPSTSGNESSRSVPNDYLHYQPGLHARAGPLPPPPEPSHIFNVPPSFSQPPPRPPRMRSPSPKRDMSVTKQAMQIPSPVIAKPSTPTSSPKKEPIRIVNDNESPPLPAHKREAAFSPSVFLQHDQPRSSSTPSGSPVKESPDPIKTENNVDVDVFSANDDPDRTIRPASSDSDGSDDESVRPSSFQLHRKGSWVNTPPGLDVIPTSPPLPPITPSMVGSTPSPPPKSSRHLPSTMIAARRDGTLPRTPSNTISIMSALTDLYPPSSPESPPTSPMKRLQHRRTKSLNPHAMMLGDAPNKKTALERCAAYANKINELYLYDCGLDEWISDVKLRGRSQDIPKPPMSPRSQTTHTFALSRQLSKSSLMTEATFPIRPDASAATDLTKAITVDLSAPSSPPFVPYPSIAPAQQRSNSNRSSVHSPASSLRSPSLIPPNKAAAFFASLGRKSSSKKEKPTLSGYSSSSSSTPKVLTKAPKPPNPKPVVIQSSTGIPGGPRALPGRQKRSQTLMISSPLQSSESRDNAIQRRPSLFTPATDKVIDIQADPVFAQQVDRLQDLLPHADRSILAGYLRRSGHDMLAIGQYLDDERNGTIKQF